MSTSLEQLHKVTEVVADTADFLAITAYKGVSEATTNPIIMHQAATLPQYKSIVQKGVDYGLRTGRTPQEKVENSMDMINVLFGEEILKVVKNRVHIQLDPRLAFNIEKSVVRALKIIKLFEEKGISRQHVVIKLPATWEGIRAANALENDYEVNCNMTTMFSLTQAVACAEAGVSYLAPFVGRINLWYQEKSKATGRHEGIETLKLIQSYLRKFEYKTKVMGAYFVNTEEVKAVAGCDTSTVPIQLLEDLSKNKDAVTNQMEKELNELQLDKLVLSESQFRWSMNENEMATDLLSEMIRIFADHYVKLENIVKEAVGMAK